MTLQTHNPVETKQLPDTHYRTLPLAIDLYCGLGGWAEGFLSESYRVVGFDIERHDYGTGGYPGQLVIQDVRTLHGSQFKGAAVIVASPPCQAYSYRAMPWKRAKALPPPDNTLFNECFRIQREACEAAGRHIPLIVENVRGAQKWVGTAHWKFGSFYLWGDVPAIMPPALFADGIKNPHGGVGGWFGSYAEQKARGTISPGRMHGSRSPQRRAASAQTAKVPFPLAQHIARVFKPVLASLLFSTTLLNPCIPQRAAHMFGLSGIAQRAYSQLTLNFEPLVTGAESQTEVTFDFDEKSRDIPQSKGVVPTEISSPRRLRVKGTDTDSLMGGRIESGETGILASDGAQANHEARPQDPHATTGSWVITEPAALPAVLAQLAKKYRPLIARVLARLSEAERKEVNPHLAQDVRQAWITVSYAQRMSDAFVQASYAIYGKHPDQIWPSIVADRKARLGNEYHDWYSSDDILRPDVPRLPPRKAESPADGADLPTGTVGGSVSNHKEVV